jgi:hypothetical protein
MPSSGIPPKDLPEAVPEEVPVFRNMSMVVGVVSFYFSSQICCKKMRNHDQS